MFSLRTRFGIPGVISVIALVFAMFGGAYAASNSSGGGKATASAKGKQGPRGKTGPAGPAGATGAKGDAGAPGANGANGANGESVTNTPVSTGVAAECNKLGGAKFTVGGGSSTFACNGAKGATGPPGPTCESDECLLPEGATVTGNWSISGIGIEGVLTSISFPLSLAAAPTFHYVTNDEVEGGTAPTQCPGNFAEPKAEAENLCVYQKARFNLVGPPQASFTSDPKSGVSMRFVLEEEALKGEEQAFAAGSWAVTAP